MSPQTAPNLKPLIVSAPFGNYVQPDGATATLGTFTAAARPGRFWQVIKTVRYYRRLGAWVNKIGLRNPGIDSLIASAASGKVDASDKIVSIHGFAPDDWTSLIGKIAELKPLAVEMNMSCPNVGEVNWPTDLFADAVSTGVPVIVKLPPVHYRGLFEQSAEAGVRTYHCCNTLPVAAGGLSGQPLKPVALQCIRDILGNLVAETRDEYTIIGGGGIRTTDDIDLYAGAGASRVAVGTKVFNPKYLWSTAGVRPLVEYAATKFV